MIKRFCHGIIASVVLILLAPSPAHAQQVALKTNLLYDATATPNIGMEIGVGKKHSLQAFYGLHPWKFGHGDDQKYLKHCLINCHLFLHVTALLNGIIPLGICTF